MGKTGHPRAGYSNVRGRYTLFMKTGLGALVTLFAVHCQTGPSRLPENVIRINVNLVQVDATVTDKSGKPVTSLKPEDFEILQDGKPQQIVNFTYVETQPGGAAIPAV